MHSTLYASSSSFLLLRTCKSSETHQNPIFKPLKFSPSKTLKLTSALRTSINYEPEGVSDGESRPVNPTCLPVVIRRSGRVSRYLWNGNRLELIGVDVGASSFCFNFEDGFRNLFRILSSAVRNFLIPKQVNENYSCYVKWKFLHRVFSAALQVLATQAMFRAIGIGHPRSLPSAAAFNWILKEGLGRLSRCIYTASLALAFDTNLKRVRFLTSVLFSLSIGVELLTPLFPQYFLLLASVANIAKQISLACYLATGSAVHQSFAIADNLGEVSAKSQLQTVCFDNIGLMLAAVLNMLSKNNERLQAGLPFIIYPLFSAIDLFGIYQGLKHVNLQTLTKDRLEMILDKWIEFRRTPSPAEVSRDEGIDLLWNKGDKKLWPIRIGCLDPNFQIPKLSMMSMQSLSSEDYCFICMETISRGLRKTEQRGIILCLQEGAGTADIITGLLQACYVRRSLASSDLRPSEWSFLVEQCKRSALDDFLSLNEQMVEQGWAVKNVLLNAQEQIRYSFVDD